jgi:CheY-specific phosphatase CheX
LESIPESVHRLNQLLSKRDAGLDDLAKLISEDKDLSARVLRAANPRADSEADYVTTTVGEALQRTGMSCALLLAMSDPLIRAVHKTFATMLRIELKAVLPNALDPFTAEHVLGEVSFAGKATGLVHLRLPLGFIPILGDRLLGLSPAEIADPATANDVIGELCNMIVGNFKSNLCDAGLNCKLSPPEISRTDLFKLRVVNGGTSQRYGFRATELDFFADLSVNPWT